MDIPLPITFGGIPDSALAEAAPLFKHGIETLFLHGLCVSDEFLYGLASSGGASTLRRLSLQSPRITDASSNVWGQFPMLDKLFLETNSLLTLRTASGLRAHPRLRSLTISNTHLAKIFKPVLAALLAPSSLPRLSTLRLLGHPNNALDVEAALLDVLRDRPNRDRIGRLVLHILSTPFRSHEIHELCPNLKHSLSGDLSLSWELISNLRDLQHYNVESGSASILKLAEAAPNIKRIASLQFGAGVLIPTSLASLQNLVQLSLSADSFFVIEEWPRHLEHLFVRFRQVSIGEPEMDSFCDSLCATAKRLKYLSVMMEDNPFCLRHVRQFLTSFPLLESLYLPLSAEEGVRHGRSVPSTTTIEQRELVLSHPNLKSMSDWAIKEFWGKKVGFLPGITVAHLGAPVHLDIRNHPFLSEIGCNGWDGNDFSELDSLTIGVSPTAHSFQAIHQFYWTPLILERLFSLSHVTKLMFPNSELDQADAAALLERLPALRVFASRISLDSSNSSFSWLVHPFLQTLHLTCGTGRAEHMAISGDANLPLLEDLELGLVMHETCELSISGFLRLSKLSILKCAVGLSPSLSICNVPSLVDLAIWDPLVPKLSVTLAPSLHRLAMHRMPPNRPVQLGPFEVPGLLKFEADSLENLGSLLGAVRSSSSSSSDLEIFQRGRRLTPTAASPIVCS